MPELLTSTDQQSTHIVVESDIESLRRRIANARRDGARIGCVPTMGALHEGHLSLIRQARNDCDYVVVTIFVNPTQFGPNEDFQRYPRPVETDLAACRDAGVDLVFHPDTATMYPSGFSTYVEVEGITDVLEGAHRPGHFCGVATVVLKLLNIVDADIFYFGQKDYQQQLVIRKLCEDLNLAANIRTLPTVRDDDGLAISSRNAYLNPQQRASALVLSRALQKAKNRLCEGECDVKRVAEQMKQQIQETDGVVPDYAVIVDGKTLKELDSPSSHMVALVAARVGETRLIDNVIVCEPQRIDRE